MNILDARAVTAVKWSALAETAVKLMAPVSSMLIARILSPEAFGVAAIASVLISLAEIIADSGFHKFIIRHPFRNGSELTSFASTAHLSNLAIAVIITSLLILFSDEISSTIGIEEYPYAIWVSSLAIPFIALGSIPAAILKRELDFKTIFRIRILTSVVPFIVTIPCSIIFHSYIALLAGYVASSASAGIGYFFIKKQNLTFSFRSRTLKRMISFSLWSVIESLCVWLTLYADIFIIGLTLSQHYVGIYRTSIITSGQVLGIVTASVTPVLFSTLSRASDKNEFERLFLNFQKSSAIAIVPIGMGMFIFADELTLILLGSQWSEAAAFIGTWSLTGIPTILTSHFCSEAYRAIGRPDYSVLAQILHLAAIVPVVYFFAADFDILCHARSLVRLQGVAVNLILLGISCHIYPFKIFVNIFPPLLGGICMTAVMAIPTNEWHMIWIVRPIIAIAIYLTVVFMSSSNRRLMSGIFKTSE